MLNSKNFFFHSKLEIFEKERENLSLLPIQKTQMALVGLDVTYGDAAIGPPRFHRVTVPGGKAADINRKNLSVGSESKAVYLWSKTSKDPKKGREITDIKVLYGKNDVPEGYELLDRDLTLGGDPAVYLALKRGGGEKDPISDIFIVFDKASVPKDEDEDTPWTSVEPSIGGGNDEVHLWIRRKKLVPKPVRRRCRSGNRSSKNTYTHTFTGWSSELPIFRGEKVGSKKIGSR